MQKMQCNFRNRVEKQTITQKSGEKGRAKTKKKDNTQFSNRKLKPGKFSIRTSL